MLVRIAGGKGGKKVEREIATMTVMSCVLEHHWNTPV